nr:hypothetical protein CFP56_22126 [Quercus suber]
MENELPKKTWRSDQPRKMCGISVLKCFVPRGWEHPRVRELRYDVLSCRSQEPVRGTDEGGMAGDGISVAIRGSEREVERQGRRCVFQDPMSEIDAGRGSAVQRYRAATAAQVDVGIAARATKEAVMCGRR